MLLPEIQDELRKLAVLYGIPRLAELASYMSRRRPKRRAPQSSASMTPQLRAEIRTMYFSDPDITQADVAKHFNVHPGRVSEAIRGKRR